MRGSFVRDGDEVIGGEMSGIDALSSFFRHLPVPLYRSAPDGSLLAGNEALASLLGYSGAEQMLSEQQQVSSYYVDPQARARWIDEIRQTGVVYDFDVELLRRDGSSIWVRDTARAVTDSTQELLFFEGCLVDVTDRIMLQRSKEIFVAAVSHELRHPISVILGMGHELDDRYESFSEAERRDMIGLIAREADEASWLIEDLLVAQHNETDQIAIAIKPFEILPEIKRVTDVLAPDVTVICSEPPRVLADPGRIRQIIRNLLSNALRYGGDAIRIVISPVGDFVQIDVSDSGDPIESDYLERIFLPFGRIPGTNHAGAVGLGLTVCRRLADVMDATLAYEHSEGWSTFRLKLPAG